MWEADQALRDLGALRALRLLAAGRRFALAQGRPPRTLADALGRAPGPGEEDPFLGTPLALEAAGDGLAITVRGSAGRRGEDVRFVIP